MWPDVPSRRIDRRYIWLGVAWCLRSLALGLALPYATGKRYPNRTVIDVVSRADSPAGPEGTVVA
jgi:hypothetical protein